MPLKPRRRKAASPASRNPTPSESWKPPSSLHILPLELRYAVYDLCSPESIEKLRATNTIMKQEVEDYAYNFRFFMISATSELYSTFDHPSHRQTNRKVFWKKFERSPGVDLDAAKRVRRILLTADDRLPWMQRECPVLETSLSLMKLRPLFPNLRYIFLDSSMCWDEPGEVQMCWEVDSTNRNPEQNICLIEDPGRRFGSALDYENCLRVPTGSSPMALFINMYSQAKKLGMIQRFLGRLPHRWCQRNDEIIQVLHERQNELLSQEERKNSHHLWVRHLERQLLDGNGELDEAKYLAFESQLQTQLETIAQMVLAQNPSRAATFPVALKALNWSLPEELQLGQKRRNTKEYRLDDTGRWSLLRKRRVRRGTIGHLRSARR
jgi:hypothetical protein